MSDDLTNRGGQDRARISLGEEHEIRYWSEKFGITREQLADAVEQVGTSAEAVAVYLDKPI
jgi:hypothetical protein